MVSVGLILHEVPAVISYTTRNSNSPIPLERQLVDRLRMADKIDFRRLMAQQHQDVIEYIEAGGGQWDTREIPATGRSYFRIRAPTRYGNKLVDILPAISFPFGFWYPGRELTDGDLEGVAEFDSLIDLNLSECGVTDDGMVHLLELSSLESLDLSYTAISNHGLAQLSQIKTLNSLCISFTRITSEGLKSLASFEALRWLDISTLDITDEVADVLANCPDLTTLRVSVYPLTAYAIAKIGRISSLRSLELVHGDLTVDQIHSLRQFNHIDIGFLAKRMSDNSIRTLACLSNLTSLDVINAKQLTDRGFQHLMFLRRLESLTLREPDMTARGLNGIYRFQALRHLALHGDAFFDTSMEYIVQLGELTYLDLTWDKVTDAGVQKISMLQHLQYLNLSHTAMTDKCLDVLIDLPALSWLRTWGVAISDEGRCRFEQARRDCEVEWDYWWVRRSGESSI
jgi:hypothetical protein